MASSSPMLLLFAATGILFSSAADAQEPSPESAAVVAFDILGTGDDAALLADGDANYGAAIVAVKQVLVGNHVVQDGINSLAVIQGSFNGGAGIFGVNQDAGNFNNQANVVAFVMGRGEPVERVLPVWVAVEKHGNVVVSSNSTHHERIEGSFNDVTGIVGVNQSAGSANNQINAIAIGVGVILGTDAIALQDNELDSATAEEVPLESSTPGSPSVVNSFRGFQGIAQVSQANGNQNSVQNVLSVSVVPVVGGQL